MPDDASSLHTPHAFLPMLTLPQNWYIIHLND